MPIPESGTARMTLIACPRRWAVTRAGPAGRIAEVATAIRAAACRVTIDVVTRGRFTIDEAIRGVCRLPPAPDEVPRRTAVDTSVDRAAERGVPVGAAGSRTTHRGIRRRRPKDEVERRHQQCRHRKCEPRQEIAAALVDRASDQLGRLPCQPRHLDRAPESRAPSVRTM